MYIILFYCVYISHAIRLTFLKKKAASGSAFVKMFRHPPEKTAVFEVKLPVIFMKITGNFKRDYTLSWQVVGRMCR